LLTVAAIILGFLVIVILLANKFILNGLGLPDAITTVVSFLRWTLLVFVTLEGLVCAFVYRKYGLISASIVYGLAIFILASGLL
jgi:hypothetical protein